MLPPRLRMKSFISCSDTKSDGSVLMAGEELGSALTAGFVSIFACNAMKFWQGAIRDNSCSRNTLAEKTHELQHA